MFVAFYWTCFGARQVVQVVHASTQARLLFCTRSKLLTLNQASTNTILHVGIFKSQTIKRVDWTYRLKLPDALRDAADGPQAPERQHPDVRRSRRLLRNWGGAEVAQPEEGPDATLDGKDVAHLTDPRQVGGLIA